MCTLYAPELATGPAIEPPAGSAAATETRDAPPYRDMTQCRDEIEKLWIKGYSTKEIADKLGGLPLHVARNLREIRKRWQRADRRREEVQAARYRDVYNEAMEAWQRSQQPRLTTTKQYQTDKPVKVIAREAESPGVCGFLRTAMSALGALDKMAAKKPAAEDLDSCEARELIASMLKVMTPEQMERIENDRAESGGRQAAECGKNGSEHASCADSEDSEQTPCAASPHAEREEYDSSSPAASSETAVESPVAVPVPLIRAETEAEGPECGVEAAAHEAAMSAAAASELQPGKRPQHRGHFAPARRTRNTVPLSRFRRADPRAVGRRRRHHDEHARYSTATRGLETSPGGVQPLLNGENGDVAAERSVGLAKAAVG